MTSIGDRMIEEARTWTGTPWKHNQRVKGLGVDCVRMVCSTGAVVGVDVGEIENYKRSPDGDSLLQAFRDRGFIEIPKDEIQRGDVLVFSATFRGQPTHVGFYTDPGLIHADQRAGRVVEISNLDFWRRLLVTAFRWA